MIFSENNSNVSKAFAASWAEINTPKHNSVVKVATKSGGSYTFEYTDLTGVLDAIRDIFKNNGLAVMQDSYTESIDGKNYVCVETTLIHNTGEWVKSRPLKFLAASGMQDLGGQITYMKRYSLSAMVGLSTEKDDDANGSSGNSYQYDKKPNSTSDKPPYKGPNNNKLEIPKTAEEAAKIVFPFGKHVGKTLKETFISDKSYIKWLLESEKTDPAILEGIQLMQVAIAQANAAKASQG